MNEYFQENKRSMLLLTGLLFILALVLFFILLRPLMSDLKRQELATIQIQDEITQLEQEIEEFGSITEEVDLEELILENKIPRQRDLDAYILGLQRLEFFTESKIETINFAYDSSINIDAVEEEDAESEETADGNNEADENTDADDDEVSPEITTEVTIDPTILNEKPEGLEVMTVRISVVSANFDEFIELLKVIENDNRISIVTNLQFTKPAENELYFEDDPSKVVSFEAELTTFYYTD